MKKYQIDSLVTTDVHFSANTSVNKDFDIDEDTLKF